MITRKKNETPGGTNKGTEREREAGFYLDSPGIVTDTELTPKELAEIRFEKWVCGSQFSEEFRQDFLDRTAEDIRQLSWKLEEFEVGTRIGCEITDLGTEIFEAGKNRSGIGFGI